MRKIHGLVNRAAISDGANPRSQVACYTEMAQHKLHQDVAAPSLSCRLLHAA